MTGESDGEGTADSRADSAENGGKGPEAGTFGDKCGEKEVVGMTDVEGVAVVGAGRAG